MNNNTDEKVALRSSNTSSDVRKNQQFIYEDEAIAQDIQLQHYGLLDLLVLMGETLEQGTDGAQVTERDGTNYLR